MNSPRMMIEEEPVVFAPPPYRDLGMSAWMVATGFFYGFATLCTLYWILYLRLFGFEVSQAIPILLWNVMPWLLASYTRKRMIAARRLAAQVRERRAALADAVTQVAQEALARKAAGSGAATNPTLARRAHWWTDTPLREENKQRLGRGGSEDR